VVWVWAQAREFLKNDGTMAPSNPAQLVLGHGQKNSSIHFLIQFFFSFWSPWFEVVLVWAEAPEY
jgi:hypothetical protein